MPSIALLTLYPTPCTVIIIVFTCFALILVVTITRFLINVLAPCFSWLLKYRLLAFLFVSVLESSWCVTYVPFVGCSHECIFLEPMNGVVDGLSEILLKLDSTRSRLGLSSTLGQYVAGGSTGVSEVGRCLTRCAVSRFGIGSPQS